VLAAIDQPLIIDGRNLFAPEEISKHGFRYVSIGRKDALPLQQSVAAKVDSSGPGVNRAQEVPAWDGGTDRT